MDDKAVVATLLCWILFLFLLPKIDIVFADSGGQVILCKQNEREALLRFKQGLIDEFDLHSSWGREEDKKECCEWFGITCSNRNGHVIHIEIGAGIGGNISDSLLELRHLNYLYLSYCNFGGVSIPEFFGSLGKLEYLNLESSNFSGIIPSELGNLTSLRYLYLGSNNLTSSIPYQMGNLINLWELDLSRNNLAFNIPYQLGNLTSLRKLDFSNNHLISNNLDWLSNLSSLSELTLTQNKLAASIPELKASLTLLNLAGNIMTKLPAGVGQLRNLEHLDVSWNSMQDTISDVDLLNLEKLRYLDLSFNSLKGTVSEAHLLNLKWLEYLDLSFNSLALNFTPGWIPPFQLNALRLANCSMGPRFPEWIRTQNTIQFVDLSCAGISDKAPDWFWDIFTTMDYLNLSHNHISGSIPNLSTHNSPHYRVYIGGRIDLSFNNFSGHLPSFPFSLGRIQLSNNMFSGNIESVCKNYTMARFLDLSDNQFSGELPDCWLNMGSMQALSLGNNKFSGHLPQALGNLSELRILEFRNNHFTGELPFTMADCRNLVFIDGGSNQLTGTKVDKSMVQIFRRQGKIPAWLGTLGALKVLILQHNNFYGSIPRELCMLNQIQILDISENNISGKIPRCFTNFSSLVSNSETENVIKVLQHNDDNMESISLDGTYDADALISWKRQESEYKRILGLLKLIDLSNNQLVGNIPEEISLLTQLRSLNISQNYLTGNIISNIGEMEMLESLDLSRNLLSGKIPLSLTKLHYLAVLDLSMNNLSGEIPTSTQLLGFSASAFAWNEDLCGAPLPECEIGSGGGKNNGTIHDENDSGVVSESFLRENYIPMIFGYIFGFWGIIIPLLYLGFLNKITDWFCVMIAINMRRWS